MFFLYYIGLILVMVAWSVQAYSALAGNKEISKLFVILSGIAGVVLFISHLINSPSWIALFQIFTILPIIFIYVGLKK